MLLRRLTAVASAGLLASVALLAGSPAQAHQAKLGNKSLASVLAADGHHFDHKWGDFDIVDKAVTTVLTAKPNSKVAVLADGTVPVTAFLPTDQAFKLLARDLTGKQFHNERQVWHTLAGMVDAKTLESVLLYHVVPGATVTYKQARMSDGAKLTTALGSKVVADVTKHGVFLVDADKNDQNARVLPRLRNLNQGNKQIAHGINRVLRPIDL